MHVHGVWDPLFKISAGELRRVGVPYVVAPHGMLDPWSLQQSRLKKRIALTLGLTMGALDIWSMVKGR
jgi:hypothetical protein